MTGSRTQEQGVLWNDVSFEQREESMPSTKDDPLRVKEEAALGLSGFALTPLAPLPNRHSTSFRTPPRQLLFGA